MAISTYLYPLPSQPQPQALLCCFRQLYVSPSVPLQSQTTIPASCLWASLPGSGAGGSFPLGTVSSGDCRAVGLAPCRLTHCGFLAKHIERLCGALRANCELHLLDHLE